MTGRAETLDQQSKIVIFLLDERPLQHKGVVGKKRRKAEKGMDASITVHTINLNSAWKCMSICHLSAAGFAQGDKKDARDKWQPLNRRVVGMAQRRHTTCLNQKASHARGQVKGLLTSRLARSLHARSVASWRRLAILRTCDVKLSESMVNSLNLEKVLVFVGSFISF